jgi:mRNA-degrading endonuclease RelE of RelBE toxin-antitoxin system
LIPIPAPTGCKQGRYAIVASSARAKSDWDKFVANRPTAMKAAFERLSAHPLEILGARQFPLKGEANKGVWQYEVTGGDRLFYAIDLIERVVILTVVPHTANPQATSKLVKGRRKAFDAAVESQKAAKKSDPKGKPKRRSR